MGHASTRETLKNKQSFLYLERAVLHIKAKKALTMTLALYGSDIRETLISNNNNMHVNPK